MDVHEEAESGMAAIAGPCGAQEERKGIATSLLAKADPEYAKVARRRLDARSRAEKLKEEAQENSRNGRLSTDAVGAAAMKAREAATEVLDLGRALVPLKLRARATARGQVLEDSKYRQAVASAASALAAEVGPWLALHRIVNEAAREGVHLPPLPLAISTMLAQAKVWTAEMVRADVLEAQDLPRELKVLLEGGG